jgi:hypothetical protein
MLYPARVSQGVVQFRSSIASMIDTANTEGGLPTEHDERRSDTRVLVSASVLVVVTVALAIVAFVVYRSGSDTEAKADRIERVAQQQVNTKASASRELVALHEAADHAYTALAALMAAYQAQITSQNHAVDVANRAADSYNAGQASIADALKTEAQTSVADSETKTVAVRNALVEVKRAFATLQQAAG